ncbi:hypothetical protein Tco_1501795 [Tanacetum coccineum]
MAPKRTTRSTPVTPSPITTTTTIIEAQLQALIDQGVVAAMDEAEASKLGNGYDSNGHRESSDSLDGLRKMGLSVFRLQLAPASCQVKFLRLALYKNVLLTWNLEMWKAFDTHLLSPTDGFEKNDIPKDCLHNPLRPIRISCYAVLVDKRTAVFMDLMNPDKGTREYSIKSFRSLVLELLFGSFPNQILLICQGLKARITRGDETENIKNRLKMLEEFGTCYGYYWTSDLARGKAERGEDHSNFEDMLRAWAIDFGIGFGDKKIRRGVLTKLELPEELTIAEVINTFLVFLHEVSVMPNESIFRSVGRTSS